MGDRVLILASWISSTLKKPSVISSLNYICLKRRSESGYLSEYASVGAGTPSSIDISALQMFRYHFPMERTSDKLLLEGY